MANPVFEGQTSGSATVGNEATSHNVTLPASVADGDLLLLYIASSNDFDDTSVSGYTRVEQSVINGGITSGAFFSIYRKTAGPSEANPTISLGSSGLVSWICQRWSNATIGPLSAWYDVIGSVDDSPNPEQPDTNPSTSDDFYQAAVAFWSGDTSVSAYPSGYGNTIATQNTLEGVACALKLISAVVENPGPYTLADDTEHSSITLTIQSIPLGGGSGSLTGESTEFGEGYAEHGGSGDVVGESTSIGEGYTPHGGSGDLDGESTDSGDGYAQHGGSGSLIGESTEYGEGGSGTGGSGTLSGESTESGEGYTEHGGSGSLTGESTEFGDGSSPGTTGSSGSLTGESTESGEGYASHGGSGSLLAESTSLGLGPTSTTNGTGAKHMKCCCQNLPSCIIAQDDFNRADSDDPGPLWNEISGDYDIVGNQLHTITPGLLITKLRQPTPVDSANYSYQFSFRHIAGGAPPKVVCKFTDTNNFDWIELFDIGSGQYKPKFWRRSGGSDTLLVDPASYPVGGHWDLSGDLVFTVCYSSLEWSISGSVGSFNWSFCLAVPATSLPASPNGLVGFIDGDYDDFTLTIHKESQNDCPQCTCFCWDGVDGKCIPETLYLTLTPVVNHTDCTTSPATHTFIMRQSLPTEPASPPPTYRPYPQKQYWYSDPVVTMEPVNDPHPMWFRLECLGNGEFELICMVYPSGAQTAPSVVSSNIIQFADQSGTNSGSPAIAVDCSPIVLTFSRFVKAYLQVGSGGPFTCTPFDALEYTTVITE